MADLLQKKESLVLKGRKFSKDIENIDTKINDFKKKEHNITKKVKCDALFKKAEKLASKIDKDMEALNQIQDKIREEKIAAIPEDLRKDHETALKERQTIEAQRAKNGQAIQKIKDKVNPWLDKEIQKNLPSPYHIATTASLNKKGDIEVEMIDRVEVYKKNITKKK